MPRRPVQEDPAHIALQREHWRKAQGRDAEQYAQMAAKRAEERARKRELREIRRAERDAAYRARGIEPGPWAWFQALSEVSQAILLGLAFAAPAAVAANALFLHRSPAPASPPAPARERPLEQPGRPVEKQAEQLPHF